MYIHLLSLGLIDGAGGVSPVEKQLNSAGFYALPEAKHYKYKYKIEKDAAKVIEQAAQQQITSQQEIALQNTFERLGIAYQDAYKKAFLEIVAYLQAEKAAQDAEDEQIAEIIAALI
jgi:hypothetical protein